MADDIFDENDIDSWYYGTIPHQEVLTLLEGQPLGTFLVRDSASNPGGFVICLKEVDGVENFQVRPVQQGSKTLFRIRDDCSYSDIPSLLSFYKRNLFRTTSLTKPIGAAVARSHGSSPRDPQRYSENITSMRNKAGLSRQIRMSAPADCRLRNSRGPDPAADGSSPLFMRVTKSRTPTVYNNKEHLTLKVGDVIKVLRRSGDNWEGELNGKVGSFPVTCAEFLQQGQEPATPTTAEEK